MVAGEAVMGVAGAHALSCPFLQHCLHAQASVDPWAPASAGLTRGPPHGLGRCCWQRQQRSQGQAVCMHLCADQPARFPSPCIRTRALRSHARVTTLGKSSRV